MKPKTAKLCLAALLNLGGFGLAMLSDQWPLMVAGVVAMLAGIWMQVAVYRAEGPKREERMRQWWAENEHRFQARRFQASGGRRREE